VRDRAGAEQGEAVLAQALAAFQTALGSRLVAAYALGSLAHGGFSPLVSDVDIGLVLADPLRLTDRVMLRSVGNAVRSGGSELHQRVSVFWGTPGTTWSSMAGCSPGPTSATASLALYTPSCSWRAPSSRSATSAGTRTRPSVSDAWPQAACGATIP
jgi:hypothetical protein